LSLSLVFFVPFVFQALDLASNLRIEPGGWSGKAFEFSRLFSDVRVWCAVFVAPPCGFPSGT